MYFTSSANILPAQNGNITVPFSLARGTTAFKRSSSTNICLGCCNIFSSILHHASASVNRVGLGRDTPSTMPGWQVNLPLGLTALKIAIAESHDTFPIPAKWNHVCLIIPQLYLRFNNEERRSSMRFPFLLEHREANQNFCLRNQIKSRCGAYWVMDDFGPIGRKPACDLFSVGTIKRWRTFARFLQSSGWNSVWVLKARARIPVGSSTVGPRTTVVI